MYDSKEGYQCVEGPHERTSVAGQHGGGHLARAHAMVHAGGQVPGRHHQVLLTTHTYIYLYYTYRLIFIYIEHIMLMQS